MDININPDPLKVMEEKLGIDLKTLAQETIFLNRTYISQAIIASINKWDLMKFQSFSKAKESVRCRKWQPRYFNIPTSNGEVVYVCAYVYV